MAGGRAVATVVANDTRICYTGRWPGKAVRECDSLPGRSIMCDSTRQYDPVLYGRDATPAVVGVELEGDRHVRLFSRPASAIVSKTVPFEPFLWLTSEDKLAGWRGHCRIEPLSGPGAFRRLVRFPDVASLESARSHLQRKSGRSVGASGGPYLYLRDPVQQYLLWSGKTHFLGMPFDRLARMQIDLEAYCTPGFEFPNPLREGDRITAIAMSDSSGWEHLISGRDRGEGEMLEEMVGEIRARDPDVIEGHNFFRFDLPYIDERARRYGVGLTVGRNGGGLRHRPARFQSGDRIIPYRNYEIHGRHVIDTWFLAQRYSQANRELRQDGLKDVARHFGLASPDRTYIPGARASWYFDHDPDTLFRYALDDVRETREISAALSPGYYVQTRIFPCRYQETALADDRTKIDWLMLREYLARRRSIPAPLTAAEPVAEKYTALAVPGVSRPVLGCDVTALYPAVMLAGDCRPKADELEVFPRLLRAIRDLRERLSGAAPAGDDGRFPATVRAGFKVLMDAFHDYLAFPAGHFNDFGAADHVTRSGGELIRELVAGIEERRCRVVAVDTGAIYFVSADEAAAAPAEEALAAEAASLPWKVELPLARYRAMLCCGPGNHALLDERDELSVSGSGLSSRGLERYRRNWLEEMLRLLLQGRKDEIPALYERYREAITHHRLDLFLLKRTETLRESLDDYQMKVKGGKQHPRSAYEVALRSERRYLPGDQVSCYVAGEGANVTVKENCRHVSEWDPASPDENVDYYKARLRDLYEQLRPCIAQG